MTVWELMGQLAQAEADLAEKMSRLGDVMEEGVVSGPRGVSRLWGDGGIYGRMREEKRLERDALETHVVRPLKRYYDSIKEKEKERKISRKGYEEESKTYLSFTSKYLAAPSNRESARQDATYRRRTAQWE